MSFTTDALPDAITSEAELEALLATPSPGLIGAMRTLDGDILILGASGKMGPSLARLAHNAVAAAGTPIRVLAAARFTDASVREQLDAAGITTITCDASDPEQLRALPKVPNVIYLLGTKFGTTGQQALTWETNAFTPRLVADHLRDARIVAFSSGNVYPFVSPSTGGATEATPPAPIGEYAQSCLARERMFEAASRRFGTRVAIFRLNYAIELRYGVLHDIATSLLAGESVDIAMSNANVIWQGDANDYALRLLAHASSPPAIVNVTGPETVSIRYLVERLAAELGVEPRVTGHEAETALLSNAGQTFGMFGYPRVSLDHAIRWTANWLTTGGRSLGKPTHFQTRDGNF